MRRDQRDQLSPGHHEVHLVEELALARPLGLALESALTQAQLLHDITVSHRAMGAEVVQTFLRFGDSMDPSFPLSGTRTTNPHISLQKAITLSLSQLTNLCRIRLEQDH